MLAVAPDQTYAWIAAMVGQCSNESVSELAARFNQDGPAALEPHGRDQLKLTYGAMSREGILVQQRGSTRRRCRPRYHCGTASLATAGTAAILDCLPQPLPVTNAALN